MGSWLSRQEERKEEEPHAHDRKEKLAALSRRLSRQEFIVCDSDSDSDVCDEIPASERDTEGTMKFRHACRRVDIEDYKFPFENLAFEGGGMKCLSYLGALRILEKAGITSQIKRVAGTSGGAYMALFFALGFTMDEMEEIGFDIGNHFTISWLDYITIVPSLLSTFGWTGMDRLYDAMGQKIAAKTGNMDITFEEVYERFGIELCVAVTDVNMMTAEYFHVKTTPNIPVRQAVKASMSIPLYFRPTILNSYGNENTYVDGGLLANFPVHCFDGWWLSLEPEDGFLHRVQPLSQAVTILRHNVRFGTFNNKTLGLKVFSSDENNELDRTRLEERLPSILGLPTIPNTKLSRKRGFEESSKKKIMRKHKHFLKAIDAFLKVLAKHDINRDGVISREELENALHDEEELPARYADRLFGENTTMSDVFTMLDADGNGLIHMCEVMRFIEGTGVGITDRFFGYQRQEVSGFWSFLITMLAAVTVQASRLTFTDRDVERTVGINVGYVRTTDFQLEEEDKQFLVEQGKRYADAFLRSYVVKNRLRKQTSTIDEDSSSEDDESTEGTESYHQNTQS